MLHRAGEPHARAHEYRTSLLISSTRLGVYYFLSLTLSVCLSVCYAASSNRFFFVFQWNRAISWPSSLHVALYKTFFALTPKIYSPKLLVITLHYHVATRGRALGTAALPSLGKSAIH